MQGHTGAKEGPMLNHASLPHPTLYVLVYFPLP
jgi:hypothetical protein